MDITNMLNTKGAAAAAAAAVGAHNPEHLVHQQNPEHQLHHLAQMSRISAAVRSPSEHGSDHGAGAGGGSSSHSSEHSAARFAPQQQQQQQQHQQQQHQPLHQMSNIGGNGMRYQSPTPMQQAPVPMLQTNMMPNPGYENAIIHNGGSMVRPLPPAEQTTKAFPCSSCGKGFARRSDLARHERIHSGIRPHICDYPGCSKQFIQRSALTVHARVHTGEKPHMCERCGKPFSDSSSLARHRRIHSGKRPYKCPYADCQKTFTRRTTLTRHQNHHTGTVEEAAAATAAALATRTAARAGRGLRIEDFSDSGSPISNTPSPHQRPMSLSPAADLPPIPQNMHRQAADYVTWNNGSLPPHMRVDIPQQGTNPRSSPTNVNGNIVSPMNMMPRSHPARYAPPPSILEPPANPDLRQQQQPQQSQQQQHQQQQPQQQSAGNMNPNMSPHATSPHLSNVGWQSPTHQQMAAAPHAEGYIYPDPYGSSINVGPHMYYQNSNIRRPQSAEPHDAYDAKPRMNELWAAPVS